jgi:hypothetical protein
MNKLDVLIEKFEKDEGWNTLSKDGSRRFDEKLIWLKKMVEQYAEKLHMSIDAVVDNFENNRDYSWPNYYQEAKFPNIEEAENITVYETLDDFNRENRKFKCPKCGNIYTHPTQCEHRIKKDGICDWTAGGLLKFGLHYVVVKDRSLVPIGIFEPVKS